MQMMFHKQHFGNLAIGLCDVDEDRNRHIDNLNEETFEPLRHRFYTVTSGGVHHPWEHKEYETRVAITGDGMVFDENKCTGEENVRIFAKVELCGGEKEVYFAYTSPWSVIGYGFPDPVQSAREMVEMAALFCQRGTRRKEECRWIVVDKKQVHKYHRSLLGKVMSHVKNAFTQGHHFFQDMKAQ